LPQLIEGVVFFHYQVGFLVSAAFNLSVSLAIDSSWVCFWIQSCNGKGADGAAEIPK
jgi:hypothetical protein